MTFLLNIILAQIKWRTTTANVYIKLEMRSVPGTHIHSYKNSPLHYLIKFDDKDFKKQFFFFNIYRGGSRDGTYYSNSHTLPLLWT